MRGYKRAGFGDNGYAESAGMQESQQTVWKKISVFYALTLACSVPFYWLILRSSLGAGGGFYATGIMWCPALAALITKRFFGESVNDFGWKWGENRFQAWSYLLPLAYAFPVYLIVWLSGLGGFPNAEFVGKTAESLGWAGASTSTVILGYVALSATIGVLISTSRALGEEIGWRGFLVPELAKVMPFRGVGLLSGIMWAAWHYPVLIFGDYNAGTPAWFGLSCFTIQVIAVSFIAAHLRLVSGSLWTGAILHASHNRFIQGVFTPLTIPTSTTPYVIDEFGVGMVVTTVIAALIVTYRGARSRPGTTT
jgi:membrane protease YdiL (CAAX protease family)